MKKAMRWYGSTNEIVTDRLRSCSAAAKELRYADKQVTGRWANIRAENSHLPFRRRERAILRLGACIVYKSSPQSVPRFTIISTHRGHSQNAAHSSLTVMLLCLVAFIADLIESRDPNTDACARLSDSIEEIVIR